MKLSSLKVRGRRAFTLVELLVVMSIIAVLIAILLPALGAARKAAQKTQCIANMRSIGQALHGHHATSNHFPSSGEVTSIAYTGAPGGTGFHISSMFCHILPFFDQSDLAKQYDVNQSYNATPGNIAVAQTVVKSFLCPDNPIRPSSGVDAEGYAYCDYMPISYCDITSFGPSVQTLSAAGAAASSTNIRDYTSTRVRGALALGSGNTVGAYNPTTSTSSYAAIPGADAPKAPTVGASSGSFNDGKSGADGPNTNLITDGLSKTILMMEDVGRGEQYGTPKYADPVGGYSVPRSAWRWAEPDTANGVSGPASDYYNGASQSGGSIINPTYTAVAGWGGTWINNNPVFGGYAAGSTNGQMPWSYNNAGPNDEAYSFHGSGCNVLFADGHVAFLPASIDPITLLRLITPTGNDPVAAGTDY